MKNIKNPKNRITNLSKYEWMSYATSYLSMARIGIEELISQNYIRKTSFEHLFSYENKGLLIPIIYNIKHAIEIIVKSLGININKQYLISHDLNDLANDLKIKMPEIKKPKIVNEFSVIINKYYKCEFWDKKLINTAKILDVKNDIFRFPDNSAAFVIDLEVLKTINCNEIQELQDDIRIANQYLGIINSQINKSKNPKLYEQMEKDGEKLIENVIKTSLKQWE